MSKVICVVLVSAALTACTIEARPNPDICKPLEDNTREEGLLGDPELSAASIAAEACIHREAYRLASGQDEPATVSRAVIQACERDVSRYVSMTRARFYRAVDQSGEGDPNQAANQHVEVVEARFREEALMRVVEGRAGNCRL